MLPVGRKQEIFQVITNTMTLEVTYSSRFEKAAKLTDDLLFTHIYGRTTLQRIPSRLELSMGICSARAQNTGKPFRWQYDKAK